MNHKDIFFNSVLSVQNSKSLSPISALNTPSFGLWIKFTRIKNSKLNNIQAKIKKYIEPNIANGRKTKIIIQLSPEKYQYQKIDTNNPARKKIGR